MTKQSSATSLRSVCASHKKLFFLTNTPSLRPDRPKKKDAESQADFIPCTCFGKTAEMIEKYFRKGQEILLEGRWQTGSYDKDGRKIYTNDCIVERVEFCGKKSDGTAPQPQPQTDEDGFMSIPDGIDEELPFN